MDHQSEMAKMAHESEMAKITFQSKMAQVIRESEMAHQTTILWIICGTILIAILIYAMAIRRSKVSISDKLTGLADSLSD